MYKKVIAFLLCMTLGLSVAGCQAEKSGTGEKGRGATADAGSTDTRSADAGSADIKSADAGISYAGNTEAESETEMLAETGMELIPEEVSMEDNYRTYYEVFVYSFYDGNGDGIGDLQGLTDKLDYINDGDPQTFDDLGCNGIWLMPVMPSPTYHKYDVTDYYSIDPEYGTMEDFEAFMSACEERGIKVIMDLVLNHSSSEHPWFQEACSYLAELGDGEPSLTECPYVDYYHFSKEKESGYCQVPGSDVWYYEAQFYYGMPDFNLYNEDLRQEIEKIVDFWLEKGVGGFRLDAAKEYVSGSVNSNVEILTWFNSMVKEKKEDAYLVAEVWTDMNTYTQYYSSGIDSVFDFAFADSDGIIANVVKGTSPASAYSEAMENVEEMLKKRNADGMDAPFYTNHDLGRSAGYYPGEEGSSQTKLAGALNLFMSGNAFIYYGEELGMKGAGKDENKRAPMYFSADPEAEGMCKGPTDMDNITMKFGSLEEQSKDKDSIYQYYKRAICLRNLYPVIRKGSVKNLAEYSSDTIAAFEKEYEGEKMIFFCNVSKEEAVIDISGLGDVKEGIVNGLYTGEESAAYEDGKLTIPGYGIVLIR